ncbi:hypothetical protein [Undibacterium sp.]|uniref:hypothetical protein n=1 Tax=Undibacterium sp. TaxID=1914977 RepID=UPI003753346E
MQVIGAIIVVIGLIASVSMNILWVLAYGRFLNHLRLNHHEHWKTVGSPVQFEDEPRYGSVGYLRYFWERKYTELGDPELTMLGDKAFHKQKLAFFCIFLSGIGLVIALNGTG